jgi:hypothetical protein
MRVFRMMVRWGVGQHQYHMVDLRAESLPEALRAGAAQLPADVAASADLAEIRVRVEPQQRAFGPE